RLLQRGEREPQCPAQLRRPLRGGHAPDPQLAARERLEGRRRGTSRPVAQVHPVPHQRGSGLARRSPLLVDVHRPPLRRPKRATPPTSSISAGFKGNRDSVKATATAMPISDSPPSWSPSAIAAAAMSPRTAGVSPRNPARTNRRDRSRSSVLPASTTTSN